MVVLRVIPNFFETTFSQGVNFLETTFSDTRRTLFEFLTVKKSTFLDFYDISFLSTVFFRRFDLSHTSFIDSNIENARFDECVWAKRESGYGKGGNALRDENEILDPRTGREKLLWAFFVVGEWMRVVWERVHRRVLRRKKGENAKEHRESIQETYQKWKKDDVAFREVENLYRQLKRNSDEKKDYQHADDFYIGEMNMRMHALRAEGGHRATRFFLWFYREISLYNASPSQALWCLVLTFVAGASVFYALPALSVVDVEFFLWNILHSLWNKVVFYPDYALWSLSHFFTALHYSFTSLIPFFPFPLDVTKGDVPGAIITFHYIQKIFSTIIWSLLILSIHRTFKR
jgi:hypothetical protein